MSLNALHNQAVPLHAAMLPADVMAGPASAVEIATQIVSKPETLTCLTDVDLLALLR